MLQQRLIHPALLPFQGEEMVCLICGRHQMSDPLVNSEWRAIGYDGKAFYFCPAEFPPDDARVKGLTKAYERCFRAVAQKIGRWN